MAFESLRNASINWCISAKPLIGWAPKAFFTTCDQKTQEGSGSPQEQVALCAYAPQKSRTWPRLNTSSFWVRSRERKVLPDLPDPEMDINFIIALVKVRARL